MHTTFPTFSYNENQKAIVWQLWSLCVLQRGGIRSISSVCVSLANEMMSAKWWGQEAAGSMSWDSACKPGTVEGLCSCFSSDWHQGWRKEITGKNHPLLYEQNQILKALSWKSRKCLSHLTCMCVSGSSAAHFGIKVECSRGNGNDGDSAGRDLGQPHHSWAASELPEKFWRALALQGHRQRAVGSSPTSQLPRCLGTRWCQQHFHKQPRECGSPACSTTHPRNSKEVAAMVHRKLDRNTAHS